MLFNLSCRDTPFDDFSRNLYIPPTTPSVFNLLSYALLSFKKNSTSLREPFHDYIENEEQKQALHFTNDSTSHEILYYCIHLLIRPMFVATCCYSRATALHDVFFLQSRKCLVAKYELSLSFKEHETLFCLEVNGTLTHCACEETNSVDHSLICKLGGYTSVRHNSVSDSETQITTEVCRDVQIEHTLLQITGNKFNKS